MTQQCKYQPKQGEKCQNEADDSGLCYWHNADIIKDDSNVREKLEAYAATGKSMEGFSLKKADLRGIKLMNPHGVNAGINLSHANLYRADLRDAHLFRINLANSSLLKANLSHANLNHANFEHADLLGVNFDKAKIEHVNWGDELVQEHKALSNPSGDHTLDYFEQAEEIYRNLRKSSEERGLFENTGVFFQREMVMRRFQMPLFSGNRILSKLVDAFCGYGEEPSRVIIFSWVIIFFCAIIYFYIGIQSDHSRIGFSVFQSSYDNLIAFLNCTYFSVVTFTTLGYGDLSPYGPSKIIAAIEAFTGSFTIALFVVVFVKKMTR